MDTSVLSTVSSFLQGVGLVVLLILTVVPIWLADRNRTLTRGGYLFRVAVSTVALIIAIYELVRSVGAAEPVSPVFAFTFVVGLVLYPIFSMLWSVHRTQDIGWSRWLNLMFLIPGVSFGWLIALLVVPSA